MIRVEEPTAGMVPTCEPLVANEHAPVQVDDRLYMRSDQAVADCDGELVGEGGDAHLGAFIERDDFGAARRLGAVHRGVRAPYQLCRFVAGFTGRETEAGRDGKRARARFDRYSAHRVAQTFGELPCGIGFVEPVDEHDELVIAEACDRVAGTRATRQDASESSQHVVADSVAERIVDVLHRIDVSKDHRDAASIASSMSEGDADAVLESRPSG